MFGAVSETADDEIDPKVRRKLPSIVVRFAKRGNDFQVEKVKRTEIIIETHRVTVIQRRIRSSGAECDAQLFELETIDVSNGSECDPAQDPNCLNRVSGEEKEPCIDSRNR
jgi:hypothetical protein